MITRRIAEVLAFEINGTAWERACIAKGKDPVEATADDILGPMPVRMTHDGGKPILSFDDDAYAEALEDMIPEEASLYHADPEDFAREVSEIAALTKQEAKIVGAIVAGAPIPEGNTGYMRILATRFRTTPDGIRKSWARAKTKLKNEWVA